MNPLLEPFLSATRRRFFGRTAGGVGRAALASLLGREPGRGSTSRASGETEELSDFPHFAPGAKRVIYLVQGGAPSHVDLMDWKPGLYGKHGEQFPDSLRMGQRLTTVTPNQAKLPMLPAIRKLERYGECGRMLSPFLTRTGEIADDTCVVNSMHTEAINHAPAVAILTGSRVPGLLAQGGRGKRTTAT